MLRYQVNFSGRGWTAVDCGIVLCDGRLAWWKGTEKGIAPTPYWMLTEHTRRNEAFRYACWLSLTEEERTHSISRRGQVAA